MPSLRSIDTIIDTLTNELKRIDSDMSAHIQVQFADLSALLNKCQGRRPGNLGTPPLISWPPYQGFPRKNSQITKIFRNLRYVLAWSQRYLKYAQTHLSRY